MSVVATVPDAERLKAFAQIKLRGRTVPSLFFPQEVWGRRSERGLDSIGAGSLFLLSPGG